MVSFQMQQKNIIKKKLENKVKKREETLCFLLFFATLVLLSIRKHVDFIGFLRTVSLLLSFFHIRC